MNLRAQAPPMWYWLLVLVLLNVVDVGCTQVELVLGGTEANPLMRRIISLWDGSLIGVYLFKLAFLGLLALVLSHRVAAKARTPILISLTVVYLMLTCWHVYTLWRS